jgi:hypothetical protein
MTLSNQTPITLHVDQEHGGIRAVVFVLLFLGFWLGYWLISMLIRSFGPRSIQDFTTLISCVGGIPVGLGLIWLVEQGLKRVWYSGSNITLDEQGIHVQTREGTEQHFTWAATLTHTNWFFRLSGYSRGGRERRVPNNWLCLAIQTQQEDERLVVFTFMPPKEAAAWTEQHPSTDSFHQIFPADVYSTSVRSRMGPPARPELSTEVLRGKHGRYWLAERRRWAEGLELSRQDFATFMRFVQSHRQPVQPS